MSSPVEVGPPSKLITPDDECEIEIDLTTGSEDDMTPSEARCPTESADEKSCLFVVMCPADGGFWPYLTCALGFLALLIFDGSCTSLFLLDSRFGMSDHLPSGMQTLEHLAAMYLFRYFAEPFSCAYINRYGFRYCFLFGSVLSVTWIALLSLIENLLFTQHHFYLAAIGGIGMGMVKTAFTVLVSTLFVANRQTAHLIVQLGSVTGMMIIPAFTQYLILFTNWQTALQVHLALMCLTLVFWLFVATPATLRLEEIDNQRSYSDPTVTVAYHVDGICEKFPTIADKIAENRQFWVRLLSVIPMVGGRGTQPSRTIVQSLNWLYEEAGLNTILDVQNVTDILFGQGTIGSRPMYRDDVLFEGNVTLFAPRLKHAKTKCIGYHDFIMSMTRVCSAADIEEENGSLLWKFPTASSRALRTLFRMPVWVNTRFLLMAATEAMVHAACFMPFMSIKGQVSQKSTSEAAITLIVGCFGIFAGRGIGHLLHERSSYAVRHVPLYHVAIVLLANGLTLFMCAMATNDLSKMVSCFAMFGFFFGYYKSIQNAALYTAFSVNEFTTVCGQISLVRAVSSCAGICIAVYIHRAVNDGRSALGNSDHVYALAGLFMLAGGVCLALLERSLAYTSASVKSRRSAVISDSDCADEHKPQRR